MIISECQTQIVWGLQCDVIFLKMDQAHLGNLTAHQLQAPEMGITPTPQFNGFVLFL